ncbi:MAG: hypothetical protein RL518_477 [Pseudomonadota bacterium]|jgi:hypothetical protein
MAKGPTQEKGTDRVSTDATQAVQADGAQLPSALQPWRDKTLTPSARLDAYKAFLHEKIAATLAAVDALKGDATKQLEIRDAPETQHWMKEAAWVKEASAEEFCQRMDYRKTPLEVAEAMVASYRFDKSTGVSTFTIPAGVSDIDAMKEMNEYFRKHLPQCERDAIYAVNFKWYEDNLPVRDMSQQREVAIVAVVKGTTDKYRAAQEKLLAKQGLHFADMRDQALAAALHACVNGGEDLCQDLWVRGSVPGFALRTTSYLGVSVIRDSNGDDCFDVAASGSPCPD